MAVKSKNLLGMSPNEWVNRLGVSDEELQGMIQQMMMNIGTQTSQSQNRMDELSAYGDAPEATRAARQRAIAYQGQMATQQGSQGLQQYASNANRQAWAQYMQGKISRENAKTGADAQQQAGLTDLFSSLGMAAGYYFGGPTGAI